MLCYPLFARDPRQVPITPDICQPDLDQLVLCFSGLYIRVPRMNEGSEMAEPLDKDLKNISTILIGGLLAAFVLALILM